MLMTLQFQSSKQDETLGSSAHEAGGALFRSRLNKEFTIDREFGLQLRHHFNLTNTFVVREKLAISQGEARNITVANKGGHQYTGRLELLPLGLFESKGDYSGGDLKREKSPKLMLSAGYSYIEDAVRKRGNQGDYFID